MNCHEFWTSVPPLADLNSLDSGAGHRGHLDECPACAVRFARHGRLAAGLALVAAESRRTQAPARVEARLVSAFRRQAGIVSPGSRHGWRAPVWWWAVAAALLVSASLYLLGGRQPAAQRNSPPAAIEWAAADAPASLDPDENASGESRGFIAVPNADRLSSTDDQVDLVRMEVPRSTMMAFGISVSADRAAELVEADVLLGADGLARAVRFLD